MSNLTLILVHTHVILVLPQIQMEVFFLINLDTDTCAVIENYIHFLIISD